jgi:hypothetical protein
VGGEYRLSRPRESTVTATTTPRLDAMGNPLLDNNGLPIVDVTYSYNRSEKFVDRGFSGSVELVLFPWVEAGVSGAYGLSDHTNGMGGNDLDGSFTQWTAGGFVNVSPLPALVVGYGLHFTDWTNLHKNDLNQFGHQTNLATFAAVQYLLRKQVYIKLVGAYDKAVAEDLQGGTARISNAMFSGRVRFMYLF